MNEQQRPLSYHIRSVTNLIVYTLLFIFFRRDTRSVDESQITVSGLMFLRSKVLATVMSGKTFQPLVGRNRARAVRQNVCKVCIGSGRCSDSLAMR